MITAAQNVRSGLKGKEFLPEHTIGNKPNQGAEDTQEKTKPRETIQMKIKLQR